MVICNFDARHVLMLLCRLASLPVPRALPPSLPPASLQAFGFLNYLMLGTSASPLRKALNDSGLGESIIGGGVEDELRQPVFSLGLKARSCLLAS